MSTTIKKITLALLLLTVLLAGCSRTYMNPEHPITMAPALNNGQSSDVQQRHLLALLLAFSDRRWILTEADCATGKIIARSPKGKTNGQTGIPVQAEIAANGEIKLHHLYGEDLSRGWANHMKRWMHFLEKSYLRYQHRDLNWLRREASSRGLGVSGC